MLAWPTPITHRVALVGMLAGCGLLEPAPREAPPEGKSRGKARQKRAAPTTHPSAAKGDGRLTVVFIVLDTVRADHLSLCGYDRPTSPVLERLRDETGASVSCHAYAPGTWTVPSHASFFTGVPVTEHRAAELGTGLGPGLPTLAERLGSSGYQTLLLSANPNLGPEQGLNRGFQHRRVAHHVTAFRGQRLAEELEEGLARLSHDEPLFAFVNTMEAHDPFPAIPEGLGWVSAQPEVAYDVRDPGQDTSYHRYLRGELEAPAAFLSHVLDGYDHGVSRADAQVDAVLQTLRKNGWLKHGFRLVVTSDHGEFLGEHGTLRHGCYTWEPVTRVPLLFYDSTASTPLSLPSPVSAMVAHDLALHGRLPSPPPPVASYSRQRSRDLRGCADMAALWPEPGEKLQWHSGESVRIDLDVDPGETSPSPLGAHPRRPAFEALVEAYAASLATPSAPDPDALELLQSLGYVE